MSRRASVAFAASMLLFAAACSGGASPHGGEAFLSEGDRAPDFTLPSASGDQVALSDLTEHKPALLYFSMGPG